MPTDLNPIPAGMPPPGADPEIGGGPSLGTATIVWQTRRNPSGSSFAAVVISIAQSSLVMSLHQYERHQWNVSIGALTENYFKYFIAWPAIILAKFSILWFYLRIFRIKELMHYAVFAGIVWAALTYVPNMVVSAYFCAPHLGEPWDFNVGIYCSTKGPLKWLVTSAAMSVVLDVYIFVLPIPIVMGLKLSQKKRLGILFIFTTAFFAVVCAVLTLVYRVKLLLSSDSMWLSAQLFICNGVENYIAIIVGAMPGCSAYFKSYIQNSAFFTAISSRLTASRGSKSQSSKGVTMKGAFKLKEVSKDSESQRSLRKDIEMEDGGIRRKTKRRAQRKRK
ncbi:hypothetical protein K469DRAFT_731838 [Zopfia rhizophila CBS 207.26]|uniref:Rhodopsin domain-containing protein n=1 Tax=Zopfia rhizophila CBS 207.26 TaxID=1314779 RepID=A0A6A6DFF2_9PEZI|nr:hypothetical protein K469DRAFT_731838 [Zopfia rhizophila CBS 207.26]